MFTTEDTEITEEDMKTEKIFTSEGVAKLRGSEKLKILWQIEKEKQSFSVMLRRP